MSVNTLVAATLPVTVIIFVALSNVKLASPPNAASSLKMTCVFAPPIVGNDSTAPEDFLTDSTSESLKKIVPFPAAGVGTDAAVFCFNINISYYPIIVKFAFSA